MKWRRDVAKAVPVVLICVAVVSMAAAAGAQPVPKVKIQVKKVGGASCTTAGACEIFVEDGRGVGVCKNKKSNGAATYCDDVLEFHLTGAGQLEDENLIVIQWSTKSSTGSYSCLDSTTYFLSKSTPGHKVEAQVQNVPACQGKSVWFYDVILLHGSEEIDRDDPGVIIDQ